MARVGQPALEHRRLEQAPVMAAHHLRRRNRGQIRSPLLLTARAECLTEAKQNQRAGDQSSKRPQQQQRRLAALATPMSAAGHPRPPSHPPRYSSTRARNNSHAVARAAC
jgi:hypothetical protein